MYRKDLSEDELLDFIAKVKQEIPSNIPVGYVDAYYEFTIKPRITEACDVILTNCYPYWEGSDNGLFIGSHEKYVLSSFRRQEMVKK